MVRRLGIVLAVATAVAAMTSCANNKLTSTSITCPSVTLDRTTSSLIQFHDRAEEYNPSSKALKIEISGYSSTCNRTRTDLVMALTVHFTATRWSSPTEATVITWPYFIAAVQRILPVTIGMDHAIDELTNLRRSASAGISTASSVAILTKEIFPVISTFPIGFNNIYLRDSEIIITLPLLDKAAPSYYQIFIGFQLTREQLEYNRQIEYNRKQVTDNNRQKKTTIYVKNV